MTGDLWKDGTSLTNTFASVTTRSLDLGLHRYTVALDAFEAPTGFGEDGAGRITADVAVSPLADPAPPPPPSGGEVSPTAQTPEPGTALLGLIALALGGGWARARRARAVVPAG